MMKIARKICEEKENENQRYNYLSARGSFLFNSKAPIKA
jgi:hypothetical protein